MKTAVVTGANGGIGKVTAFELAKSGARVFLACRNRHAADAAAAEIRQDTGNDKVEVVDLDLSSFRSVRACAAELARRADGIDILVNNAGIYTQGSGATEDGIHTTLQVNYFSPALLTLSLLPQLTARGAARVVNVTSAMCRIGRLRLREENFLSRTNGMAAYADSKLALLLFTISFAERYGAKGIAANALHPGLVDTKIMTLGKWYDVFIRGYMDKHAIDVREGARTSVYLALSADIEGQGGAYFERCARVEPRLRPRDLERRDILWEKTLAAIGPVPGF